jgi:alkyl sulfatase BDS1-like metallo-beta-lactamase superfamily hydrolase
MMGGAQEVFEAARKATDAGDDQWSAELLTHVIRVDTKNMDARNLKAKNLRQIGYKLTNNNWRNCYMTSALELEGKLDHDKAIDLQAPDVVKVFPPARIFESLRFRVDGPRAAKDGVTIAMGVTLTDLDQHYALTLRNGVLEFLEQKPAKPDVQLAMDSATLASILSVHGGDKEGVPTATTPADTLIREIENGKVKVPTGSIDGVKRFFTYVDKPSKEALPITLK